MGKFYTDLQVREIKRATLFSRAQYALTSPLIYKSDTIGFIIVDECEKTDFDSTPRLPFFYWILGNRGKPPAVLHDHIYDKKCDYAGNPISRLVADKVLRGATYESLRIDSPMTLGDSLYNILCLGVVWLIWSGVRLGGWMHW